MLKILLRWLARPGRETPPPPLKMPQSQAPSSASSRKCLSISLRSYDLSEDVEAMMQQSALDRLSLANKKR
jgi:hypothetical protein